ncbi:ABC transporter permease, partial [Pseudomonas sp. MDMC17]
LLVGAVGILTIMTTAVAERAAEIGLLRAVGATSRQVLALFLGEALLLSLLGGLAGLLLMGALLGALQLALPGLPLAVQPGGLLALLLAALVGGLSGIVPARRAARLQPVEALHSE